MTKTIAISILTTMAMGIAGFLATEVYSNTSKIAKIETESKNNTLLLIEVRYDIKEILKRVPNERD